MTDSADGYVSRNIRLYDLNAARMAAAYDAVSTPDAIPWFAERLKSYAGPEKLWALDVGCGSGRDARWMADAGFEVIGIDGSAAMIDHATRNSVRDGAFLCDPLPALAATLAFGQVFDIALLNAVVFHFDADDRQVLYRNMLRALKPDAYVYMTLRRGEIPAIGDIFDVPLEEIERLARDNGGSMRFLGRRDSPVPMPGIGFDHVELRFGTSPI